MFLHDDDSNSGNGVGRRGEEREEDKRNSAQDKRGGKREAEREEEGKTKNPKNVVTPPSSIHPSIHPWTPSPSFIHHPSKACMFSSL